MKVFDYEASTRGAKNVRHESQVVDIMASDLRLGCSGRVFPQRSSNPDLCEKCDTTLATGRNTCLEDALPRFLDLNRDVQLRQRIDVDIGKWLAQSALNYDWVRQYLLAKP